MSVNWKDSLPRWDPASGKWYRCEALGDPPAPWTGKAVSLVEETTLRPYQVRQIPVVPVRGLPVVTGPRPPFISWHGHVIKNSAPLFEVHDDFLHGMGIYVLNRYQLARSCATEHGVFGEVLALQVDVRKVKALDTRIERIYSRMEARGLMVDVEDSEVPGPRLLEEMLERFRSVEAMTQHVLREGFNAIVYSNSIWCLLDPRLILSIADASSWSDQVVEAKEMLDPFPEDREVRIENAPEWLQD